MKSNDGIEDVLENATIPVDDGGFVHPVKEVNSEGKEIIKVLGISRRDWLAGLAMQSLIVVNESQDMTDKTGAFDDVAYIAYAHADVMIEQGKK